MEAAGKITGREMTPEATTVARFDLSDSREALAERYREVRRATERLCEPLTPEDCVVQSMPAASPTKWHLAHTSWFFDTFVLKWAYGTSHSTHPAYQYLFNSYYYSVGTMHAQDCRGLISRPTLQETYHYRQEIDRRMMELFSALPEAQWEEVKPVVVTGLHHEQQHQELILTDIKHVFGQNPLFPAYHTLDDPKAAQAPPLEWVGFAEGVYWIGHEGDGFSFDNEGPRHRQFLEPFYLASRPVTNEEFMAFIEDGGYERPELWLSLGWRTVKEEGWQAPIYWTKFEGGWHEQTLSGLRPVYRAETVCHLSYFEANAFARWAGARLPTEAEWEVAARDYPIEGNLAETGRFHPDAADETSGQAPLRQLWGGVWEWTRSPYAPYPGYDAPMNPLGEYNGKFMCNQMVLRGGSCATPESHLRSTYRNFFPPEKRWQFTGLRLAKDTQSSNRSMAEKV